MGLDIQWVQSDYTEKMEVGNMIKELQLKQRTVWSRLDPIKKGVNLSTIQDALSSDRLRLESYDSQGLRLVRLAAACNRKDILQWLIETKKSSMNEKDRHGRTVLQVAKDCNAAICVRWMQETSAADILRSFISSVIKCKQDIRRKRKALHLIVFLQARTRGYASRCLHRANLLANTMEAHRFRGIWARLLSSLDRPSLCEGHSNWTSRKDQEEDIASSSRVNDRDLFETVKVLRQAGKQHLLVEADVDDEDPMIQGGMHLCDVGAAYGETNEPAFRSGDGGESREQGYFDKILLTKEVMKWLRVADSAYRQLFVARMEQLARGDRGRILAKRLTGSKTTVIYETYLEQKSGFRILWTETSNGCLLIWYISKHKTVSRLMDLIDDAESRSARQLTSARDALGNEDDSRLLCPQSVEHAFVMLDPRGHTPLKLYSVGYDELDKLVDDPWDQPLHLTDAERNVVESPGTTLLLGRSGTGKTVCICNRMDYDRFIARDQHGFSQLFVARSSRLRDYVECVVGEGALASIRREFTAFRSLVLKLEQICQISRKRSPSIFSKPVHGFPAIQEGHLDTKHGH
jgi:hypothetical protein